jgi:hypothetical protein
MAVAHQFNYSVPEGQTFIRFEDWVLTLSATEQAEFQASKQRQEAYRQEAIDRGDMIRDFSGVDPTDPTSQPVYVWRDEETARKGKPFDPIWKNFWNRYLEETGIEFDIIETELKE